MNELQAVEKQREQQQGHGRPIISTQAGAYRVVAVGNELLWSEKWRTFTDFLWAYMKHVLGAEQWGNLELAKSPSERHPLLNWYQQAAAHINRHIKKPGTGKVYTIQSVGIVSAYLQLAYNLYLIAHNEQLHARLVNRLKHPEQFLPAYYETSVFAALLRAGFELEFEDETDSSHSHCEVTATYRQTGKQFSVEAKMRQPTTASLDIGRQLKKALRKHAAHTRIVFIEVNIPEQPDDKGRVHSLEGILSDIKKRESEEIAKGEPLPAAYVVVTNQPYLYFPDEPVRHWALTEGFRLPDFGWGKTFPTLREAVNARDKHREMFALLKSWEQHHTIPSTFDGEIAQLEFGESHARLIIGHRYNVPDEGGQTVAAELLQAVVFEKKKTVLGIYRTDHGRNIIAECPMTDDEFTGYKRHPDTFFGQVKSVPRPNANAIELYDWFHEAYRHNSKEKLLDLMHDASDFESLQALSQEELARTFSERTVHAIICG